MTNNILTDFLPETVTVDGREYPIRTDFRSGIRFEQILFDKELSDRQKFQKVMEEFYGEETPKNKAEALNAVIDFYRCGKKPVKAEETSDEGKSVNKRSIYDFRHDDAYIYAAFIQQYGIDLSTASLHWWKFMALFRSLTDETLFVKIMGYRAADTSKIKNRAERERIAKLKEVYALPVELTYEEKLDMAGAAFGG